MCNRFRMTAKQAELAAGYGITVPYPEDVTLPPPELFPKRPAWVVRALIAEASGMVAAERIKLARATRTVGA